MSVMSVLLVFIAIMTFYIHRIGFRKYYLALKIPGPYAIPFVGSILPVFNKTPAEKVQVLIKLINDHNGIVALWIRSEFHVFLTDLEGVKIILSSKTNLDKNIVYDFIKPWLNGGLLLSSGSKWHQRRKMLTPAFHYKMLEQTVEIFDQQSCVLIETLSKYLDNEKVEIFPLIKLFLLDSICESAMGIQVNAQRSSNSEYVSAIEQMKDIILARANDYILGENFIYQFSSLYREQKKVLKIVHGFTDSVIRERKSKMLTQDNDAKEGLDESLGIKKKINLLDILLKSTINGSPLSDLDIREEVDTFMFEGHDSLATGTTFCLYYIAKYSDVQRKCFQEIRDVFGDDRTKPASINELNNLNYLELVIKESLRLFSPVPVIGRTLQEEIKIGKHTLPKGTEVNIPIYLLGRDPKIFENPEQFQPERHLTNTTDDANSFAYIPFSAGPRNCIGQKYAILEMKSTASKVLRYFEMSLAADSVQDPSFKLGIVLSSENELNFHIKPRMYQ